MSFLFPGSEVGASPQSGRRNVAAEGALLPPTPPSPRNLIPHGHRKCHSLGYKSAFYLAWKSSDLFYITFQNKSFAFKKKKKEYCGLYTLFHLETTSWQESKIIISDSVTTEDNWSKQEAYVALWVIRIASGLAKIGFFQTTELYVRMLKAATFKMYQR